MLYLLRFGSKHLNHVTILLPGFLPFSLYLVRSGPTGAAVELTVMM